MHQVFDRAYQTSAYWLTTLLLTTVALGLTTTFQDFSDLGNQRVVVSGGHVTVSKMSDWLSKGKKNDVAILSVDAFADLHSLFNWNVKLLFVYIVAEYATESNVLNQIVIWDKIIQRGEDPVVDLRRIRPKYLLRDDGNGLRGNNVTLRLKWNVIPYVGSFVDVASSESKSFLEIPAIYGGHS